MAASSQCSGSCGGASAGGDCNLADIESFDSESDVSSGHEVTSQLKSPSPARKVSRSGTANKSCACAEVISHGNLFRSR